MIQVKLFSLKEKQALIKTHRYKNDTVMRPMVNYDKQLINILK